MKYIKRLLYKINFQLGNQTGLFWMSFHGYGCFWCKFMIDSYYFGIGEWIIDKSDPTTFPAATERNRPGWAEGRYYGYFLGIPFHLECRENTHRPRHQIAW